MNHAIPIIAGLVAPRLISNISRSVGVWSDSRLYIVAFIVFFFLGFILACFVHRYTLWAGAIAVVSLAIGVPIDAMLDLHSRNFDRNLWPFEIVIWWVFAPVPIIFGIFIAKAFLKLKRAMI